MFNSKNFKNKIIINVVVLFLFGAVVIYFVIFPSIKNIKEIKGKIAEQREQLEIEYLKSKSIKNLEERKERVKNNLEFLNKPFIQEDNSLQLITTLENLAEENRLDQDINILSESSKKKGTYEIIPVEVFVKGDFNNCLSYLIDLETLEKYININSIEIKSSTAHSPRFIDEEEETKKETSENQEKDNNNQEDSLSGEVNEEIASDTELRDNHKSREITMLIRANTYWAEEISAK